MAKYVFPAIFQKENDCYLVNFPDIKNCFTDGENIADALDMAADVLCLMLCNMEEKGEPIPSPTDINDIALPNNSFASLVFCDTLEYRKLYDNKAIKKTLTLPTWLNTMAEKSNVNFSAVLQTALIEKLGLSS